MNKKPQDMNVLAKFKVYSLFEDALRQGSGLRFMLLAALLALALPAAAQTQYVFMRNNNSTTYYYANGATWSNSNTFNPSYIWTVTSNVPFNNGRYLVLTQNSNSGGIGRTNYTYTPQLNNTSNSTYTFNIADNSVLYQRLLTYHGALSGDSYNDCYLPYDFSTFSTNTSNDNRVIAYQVTSGPNTLVDNITLPTISISSSAGNTITFGHNGIGGSYVPANTYTVYTFNNAAHNWYNSQDWGTAVPTGAAVLASSLSPTYTWSLTADGGGVASIDPSTGVLTLSGAPTANITVRLTVGNITSPPPPRPLPSPLPPRPTPPSAAVATPTTTTTARSAMPPRPPMLCRPIPT